MGLIVGHSFWSWVWDHYASIEQWQQSKGALRKTWNDLILIKILVDTLLDYRSCETDRCICIGCIGLDPPLFLPLMFLKCFLLLKNIFTPISRTNKKMGSGGMVAKLLQNCEILTYFPNNLTLQSRLLTRQYHNISWKKYLLYTVYQGK